MLTQTDVTASLGPIIATGMTMVAGEPSVAPEIVLGTDNEGRTVYTISVADFTTMFGAATSMKYADLCATNLVCPNPSVPTWPVQNLPASPGWLDTLNAWKAQGLIS